MKPGCTNLQAHQQIYQISSNCMTGISEEEEWACPGGKKWTPSFTLFRQLIWSIEYFFNCVYQKNLGCSWAAAQRRIWPLLLCTRSSDKFAGCWTFEHLYLFYLGSSTVLQHDKQSSTIQPLCCLSKGQAS